MVFLDFLPDLTFVAKVALDNRPGEHILHDLATGLCPVLDLSENGLQVP